MMMMPSNPGGPSRASDPDFSRALRFELADEENRALLGSYAISTSIGVAFLLLLQFGPQAIIPESFPSQRSPFVFRPDMGGVEPTVYPSGIRGSSGNAVRPVTPASDPGAIGNAFASPNAGAGATTDHAGLLRGVAVNAARGSATGEGGKTVLGMGSGGTGSTIPGRGGVGGGQGGSGAGNGIGGMTAGAGVTRAVVSVSGPEVVPVDPLPRDGRNASELGTFVRAREAELRFCYEENGLKANPNLGGSITVAVTVAGTGAITNAQVTRRTWSGRGAAESEACILRAVRGWRLPPSDGGAGTHAFPFNFTR